MPRHTLTGSARSVADANYTDALQHGPLTPEQRRRRAQIAAERSWANTTDRPARTRAARERRWQGFVDQAREIHPDGSDEVIVEIAEGLRRLAMRNMALKSARVRRQRLAEKVGTDG